MYYVKDFNWKRGITASEVVDKFGELGFQSIELKKAADTIIKMKEAGAKIFLTFTSNMTTSGLRGFFAQLIRLGMVDFVVTTVGSVEEDIMRAGGEKFVVGSFSVDDVALNEEGVNRVGNLFIKTTSYERFESVMRGILNKAYAKKSRWPAAELLKEIGADLNDENSILYQAARKNVPVYCPAVTDGAFGFHLYMFQQDHKDFVVDVIKDFGDVTLGVTHDDVKGVICLGGGVSKHYALFACLINGGFDYAVYMTTAHESSGSMSGASTQEAKSWGKIKDTSDAVTVIGDVTITFPLAMTKALDELAKKKIIKGD